VKSHDRVVPVDDLPAAGDTVAACRRLIESLASSLTCGAISDRNAECRRWGETEYCPVYSFVK
jgi:adenine/guanine phosphoribosyltransferase-like PRPP-binding protein